MSHLAARGGDPVRSKSFPTWPIWGDEEIENLTSVIKSGQWGSLKGKITRQFEEKFAEFQQAQYGIAVNSGTTALQIALMAADIPAGTEVIVPAYTFIATATAVVEMGAIPVFVDIDPETYNIDPDAIENAITEKTSAIMPVHFAGRSADMDKIMKIAKSHHLKIIEDAAQAWGSEWDGRRVGALGDAGCFSFQSSKNINAGEGGIILTNDHEVAKFARSHANCGRSEEGLWYEHFYFGGNWRITEFQSAVLMAQLQRYDELLNIRQENAQYLFEQLGQIDGFTPLRNQDKITSHSMHLFISRYDKQKFANASKESFVDAMRNEGIPTSPGYSLPLYKQPVFVNKAFGPRGRVVELPIDYTQTLCPETERACYEEAIWFPQFVMLGTREDMDDIVAAVKKISDHSYELAE